jgi:DNA-binding Xre family transcriptional regulator
MGKHRYSIKDVHERSALSLNTISSLYYDKVKRIDYDAVVKLCKVFTCDIGDLLSLRADDEPVVDLKKESIGYDQFSVW